MVDLISMHLDTNGRSQNVTKQANLIGETELDNGNITVTTTLNHKGIWRVQIAKSPYNQEPRTYISCWSEQQRQQAQAILEEAFKKLDEVTKANLQDIVGIAEAQIAVENAARKALLLLQGHEWEDIQQEI